MAAAAIGTECGDCPLCQQPSEAPGRSGINSTAINSMVTAVSGQCCPSDESLEERCRRLREEWVAAEHQKKSGDFQAYAGVDKVTGALGPLFYARVAIKGMPIEGLIDPGSSATFISYSLFREIGKRAKLSSRALELPTLTLRDYSQNPIPIGAQVSLTFQWHDRVVTTPVHTRSDAVPIAEPCLLGTNVVIPLGLMMLDEGVESRGGTEVSANSTPVSVTQATVCLVGTQRIPGRCAKMVTVESGEGFPTGVPVVFEPNPKWMKETGLEVESSLVELNAQRQMELVLHNPSGEPLLAAPEVSVGNLLLVAELVTESAPVESAASAPDVRVTVSVVRGLRPHSDDILRRQDKLIQMVDVCSETCTGAEAASLTACLRASHDTFAVDKTELGEVVTIQHQIHTGASSPVRQPPRRMPFALRPEVTTMINEMLQMEVIQESSSPWASPVVLVKKKSGDLRFCVDYRRLNAVTRKDVFPLPRIDDLVDQLSGRCVFSTHDARSGYWQIRVEESSQPKTAFVTMDGLYEFRVMPFGLCNAPATFQRVIQKVLAGLNDFCSIYIDDILVFSRSVKEHLHHLAQVFERLRKIGLKLHPQKCRFAYPEVSYLGHVILAEASLLAQTKRGLWPSFGSPPAPRL